MTRLKDIYARQGLAPPSAEVIAQQATAKKANNVATAERMLKMNGITWVRLTQIDPTDPIRFAVHHNGQPIQYFPENGRWSEILNGRALQARYGVRKLIRFLKGEVV